MRKRDFIYRTFLTCCIGLVVSATSAAQSPLPGGQSHPAQEAKEVNADGKSSGEGSSNSISARPDDARENELGLSLIKNLVRDQKAIWTSPAHIRMGDVTW